MTEISEVRKARKLRQENRQSIAEMDQIAKKSMNRSERRKALKNKKNNV
jgi:hypothetical protein